MDEGSVSMGLVDRGAESKVKERQKAEVLVSPVARLTKTNNGRGLRIMRLAKI